LLIASNHPNSFLDAIVVATVFKRPVYSLTRGDVFKGKLVNILLKSLNMLPVYRISEGAENLGLNYETFGACGNIFENGGIVLIFSEGRCINEWRLRPLKKGTARLALAAWQQEIPLKVIPLGINYSSFRNYGKTIILNFGDTLTKDTIYIDNNQFSGNKGKIILQFNKVLRKELHNLVYDIDKHETEKINYIFGNPLSPVLRILLLPVAVIGYVIHYPVYATLDFFLKKKANDHYDSMMIGLLFFVYPFYLLFLTLLVYFVTDNTLSFLLLLFVPGTALAYLHFKENA
jgi:1-acyl-sn-glycerol-3-phosphate acyltransferase